MVPAESNVQIKCEYRPTLPRPPLALLPQFIGDIFYLRKRTTDQVLIQDSLNRIPPFRLELLDTNWILFGFSKGSFPYGSPGRLRETVIKV